VRDYVTLHLDADLRRLDSALDRMARAAEDLRST